MCGSTYLVVCMESRGHTHESFSLRFLVFYNRVSSWPGTQELAQWLTGKPWRSIHLSFPCPGIRSAKHHTVLDFLKNMGWGLGLGSLYLCGKCCNTLAITLVTVSFLTTAIFHLIGSQCHCMYLEIVRFIWLFCLTFFLVVFIFNRLLIHSRTCKP